MHSMLQYLDSQETYARTAVETFRFLGSTISQDLKWVSNIDTILKMAPAEDVLPAPAQEVQPASGAAESLLLLYHPVCSMHVHHCLVWISHQQTTTDCQVCREDHWCQPALHPGLVHLQSQETGRKPQTQHTLDTTSFNSSPLVSAAELCTAKPPDAKNSFFPLAVTVTNNENTTWVGGAFITGIAEAVYDPTRGLVWGLVPLQTSISFIIGGLFFAKPMRENQYISMMDPFQRKYGNKLTAVFAIIPLMTELIWIPISLISLGATMSVVIDLPFSVCVWISAVVVIIYTVLGGLYSVAYTDVIQISLVFLSVWLCVPFVLTSDGYTDISETAFNLTNQGSWLGHIKSGDIWRWIDNFLLMTLDNLAAQDFHQRTLSSCSTSTARIICFIAAGVVIILGIPSVLIGAVAASTDWNSTSYGSPPPYERGEAAMVLPIILQNSTPIYIFALGIGAVAAAAMSSADSSLLSATTIFTTNIYQTIRSQASDKELQWVIRLSIVAAGLVGTSFTYLDNSIMVFWILGSDLTYTIILPLLICVLFIRVSNGYGAGAGFAVAVVIRVLCGEPLFGLPVILHFPGDTLEDGVYVQRFPVKSFCMLFSLASILLFSYVASLLFNKGILPERWDVFKVKSQEAPPPAEEAREADGDDKCVSEPMLDTKC